MGSLNAGLPITQRDVDKYFYAHDTLIQEVDTSGGLGGIVDLIVKQGSYLGDGTSSQAVNLGFRAKFVLVVPVASNDNSFMRFDTLQGGESFGVYSTQPAVSVANAITSITNGGFTVGLEVNEAGIRYHFFALAGGRMATGTYPGREIPTGETNEIKIGFQPVLVLLGGSTFGHIFKAKGFEGNISRRLGQNSAPHTDGITSLDEDGFTIGTLRQANGRIFTPNDFLTMHWVAIRPTGKFTSGVYIGDSTNDRDISVGWKPSVVFVTKGLSGNIAPVFFSESVQTYEGGKSKELRSSRNGATNRVQALHNDGFQVGTDLNTQDTPFHWIAFRGEI